MRICLVGSHRFPIREPFAGGLEALTYVLARELVRRGHEVTLFAGEGSDVGGGVGARVRVLVPNRFELSAAARADVNAPSGPWMAEHHAYLALMLDLGGRLASDFDVVHNNSLHHLPVAMASAVPAPVVTTLHTPPTPWLESAFAVAPAGSHCAAVSAFTARAWSHVVPSTIIHNGVDLDLWRPGRGGGPVVWSGRMAREKAPHQAIEASRRAGVQLVLAGPMWDIGYFDAEVRPHLGSAATYVGHVDHAELAALVAGASVAVVTPDWDEPYGLVAAEAMACGTPVAAYARGALPELLPEEVGALALPGNVDDLARAIGKARLLDREAVRRHAVEACSMGRMVDEYERLYARLAGRDVAA